MIKKALEARHQWLTPVTLATQEDRSSKLAQANSSQDPTLKKTNYKKRVGGVTQGVGPELKPQNHKKKKK
jgi:hypothetical protein